MNRSTTLSDFYRNLHNKKKLNSMRLCHSTAFYTLMALRQTSFENMDPVPEEVRQRAMEMTVEELEDMFLEEGLLSEQDYDVSDGYIDKWLNNKNKE